jgi:general secretion pathway protein G
MRGHQGFTLIELLIVVAIIGIIAAIAVPNLLAAIQRAKINRTAADMSAIKTALGSYLVDQGFYPLQPTLATFTDTLLPTKYFEGSMKDGWGRSFRYRTDNTGNNYVLASGGKDGTFSGGYSSDHWDNPIDFEWSGCHPAYKSDGYVVGIMLKIGCDIFVVNGIFPTE